MTAGRPASGTAGKQIGNRVREVSDPSRESRPGNPVPYKPYFGYIGFASEAPGLAQTQTIAPMLLVATQTIENY